MNNVNAARDEDADAGFYAAVCASDPEATFRGAKLFRSLDGTTYPTTSLVDVTAEAVMGYATNALGDFHGGNIPDELNVLNVTLANGSLSSTTTAGLLAGTFMFLLGREWIFGRDATLQANGSYNITGMLRGRRGTEYAMGEHAIADRFVLVNAAVVRVPQVSADIGIERQYKMVAGGRTVASATAKAFTNEGTGLKPYAPVHLGGGRNADDDVTLTWVRRNVIDGSWRDGVDVPMSETTEAYEVDIYDDSDYTTVLRTISATTQTATYLASEQTADGLTPGDPVYFKVYQLSSSVGRGQAASGSV